MYELISLARIKPAHVALFVIILLASCRNNGVNESDNGVIVALENRVLTYDKIQTIIHPEASEKDSIAIFNAYVDNWIRDQLLMREAAKKFATDLEIEQLVDDYRESLLKYRLEDSIIKERFDSTVTSNELFAFYNEFKSQFVLKEPVFRCLLVQIDPESNALKALQKAWKDQDIADIVKIADSFILESIQDTSRWYNWSDIYSKSHGLLTMPTKQNERMQEKSSDEAIVFFKMIDSIDKNELSPLLYIQDELIMMILHKRRKKIIEDYRQELYNQALRNNEIKLNLSML